MEKIKRITAVFSVAVAIMPILAQAEEMRYGYCKAIISFNDYKKKVVFSPVRPTSIDYSYNARLENKFRAYIKSKYGEFIDEANCFVAINSYQEAEDHRSESIARARGLYSTADFEVE